MVDFNIILDTDSYKTSHWLQYPPNTTRVFSYIESRGGYDESVFFGLQYVLTEYLSKSVTRQDVNRAAAFYSKHGVPFNHNGWLHIAEDHNGNLPLRIRALPEGTVVPASNCMVTVENTCSECYWLTSWVETSLMRVWYPINVASKSRRIKQIISRFLEMTSDDPAVELPFKLHDFGSRGAACQEAAALGGAAHLVNFMGTDTVVGAELANIYYGSEMSGFSIPAAEHSTITSWGKENEVHAYRNMLKQFAKPGKIVAVVSDSYNIYHACEHLWGRELKQEVIDSGATVVVRPDSGDPVEIVMECLRALDRNFGHTVNSKGYKVLNHVRVIQGDGIDEDDVLHILMAAADLGFSATNIAFGMGGALLQKHNRDTHKFAMKCSYIEANGKGVDVFKKPITDPGKVSKTGRLDVVRVDGKLKTVVIPIDHTGVSTRVNVEDSVMETVFLNGNVLKTYSLDEVRSRATL